MVLLRHVRVLFAGLAVCLVPSLSRADTQILVQEVDSHGNVIAGTTQTFGNSTNITTTTLPGFSKVTITANSSSGAVSSLTTTVNATPGTSFDSSVGLQVIVTSTGFTTPNGGGLAVVTNNASASSAIAGGQNQLTSNTQLLNDPSGTNLGSATGAASDVRPSGGISPTTSTDIANFPTNFAIQQTITVNAINVDPTNGIASGSTLGGSASSLVTTQPVPAPGGLALALVGLPLIGLRRWLKKSAQAA